MNISKVDDVVTNFPGNRMKGVVKIEKDDGHAEGPYPPEQQKDFMLELTSIGLATVSITKQSKDTKESLRP